MKLTINTDDPDKIINAVMVAKAFMATYLPSGKYPKHRNYVLYAPSECAPPFPYEIHVWGNSDHVRVHVYTTGEKA